MPLLMPSMFRFRFAFLPSCMIAFIRLPLLMIITDIFFIAASRHARARLLRCYAPRHTDSDVYVLPPFRRHARRRARVRV